MSILKYLKSIFTELLSVDEISQHDLADNDVSNVMSDADYDSMAKFYYSNLVNSIILFSLESKELEKLGGPVFNPLFELETEIDYAFTPILFETIFRKKLIDENLKLELLAFKNQTDNIPPKIWDWNYIDNHPTWRSIRQDADGILTKLGIEHRIYSEDYTTVIGSDGSVLKQGKSPLS